MDKNESDDVLKLVEGMKKVDPHNLAEYEKKMKEEVIPEIVEVVEKRRLFAAESRVRHLTRSGSRTSGTE
jgi:hypothetical protein